MAYPIQPESAVLAALADATRRSLLTFLRAGPLPVGELAGQLPISRPAVSQHLKLLRTAQLVLEERAGARHLFSLNPDGFIALREYAEAMVKDAVSTQPQNTKPRQKDETPPEAPDSSSHKRKKKKKKKKK